jgi:hypothetical protein
MSVSDWSVKQRIVFWWGLLLLIQQVERWFLLPDVVNIEAPDWRVLIQTFTTGFRADLITSTIGILLSVLAAGLVSLVSWPLIGRRSGRALSTSYGRAVTVTGSVVGMLLVVLLLLDIGYYRYNQQRLNFVFFEYLGDLITQWKETGIIGSQAAGQTGAELEDRGKWAGIVLSFLFYESVAILAWWRVYAALIRPWSSRLVHGRVLVPNLLLLLALAVGLTGFHPRGPEAIRAADISSAAYYTLAQNPVLYAGEGLRAALDAQWTSGRGSMFGEMPLDARQARQCPGHFRRSLGPALPEQDGGRDQGHAVPRPVQKRQRILRAFFCQRRADGAWAVCHALLILSAAGDRGHEDALPA